MEIASALPIEAPAQPIDIFKALTLAVDDNPDDLYALLWGLQSAGLSCVPLLYDAVEGLKNGHIQDLSTARVVFLDLNLEKAPERGSSDQANHIRSIFGALNLQGPYLLIVWSDFRTDVHEVLCKAFERANNIIFPTGIAVLDKEKFQIDDPGQAKKYDFSKIGKHIASIISQYPQMSAIMAWENRSAIAASSVSKNLFNLHPQPELDSVCAALKTIKQQQSSLTQPQETTGTQEEIESLAPPLISQPLYQKEVISTLFHTIGQAACGQHTDDYPVEAIESGLIPLLEDQFLSTPATYFCSTAWKSVFAEKGSTPIQDKAVCKLNTCLHLDVTIPPTSRRGVWLEPVTGKADVFFKDYLGSEPKVLRNHFFNHKKINEIEDSNNKNLVKQERDASRIGIIECSAACDQAWKEQSVRLFLLAALIPIKAGGYISSSDSIYPSEKIYYDGSEYKIAISFSYPVSLKKDIFNETEKIRALFRVRDQLLGAITARFAAYSSRPGIVSIH